MSISKVKKKIQDKKLQLDALYEARIGDFDPVGMRKNQYKACFTLCEEILGWLSDQEDDEVDMQSYLAAIKSDAKLELIRMEVDFHADTLRSQVGKVKALRCSGSLACLIDILEA